VNYPNGLEINCRLGIPAVNPYGDSKCSYILRETILQAVSPPLNCMVDMAVHVCSLLYPSLDMFFIPTPLGGEECSAQV